MSQNVFRFGTGGNRPSGTAGFGNRQSGIALGNRPSGTAFGNRPSGTGGFGNGPTYSKSPGASKISGFGKLGTGGTKFGSFGFGSKVSSLRSSSPRRLDNSDQEQSKISIKEVEDKIELLEKRVKKEKGKRIKKSKKTCVVPVYIPVYQPQMNENPMMNQIYGTSIMNQMYGNPMMNQMYGNPMIMNQMYGNPMMNQMYGNPMIMNQMYGNLFSNPTQSTDSN